MISAARIGNALAHAQFPIRSFEELHAALHRHLGADANGDGCAIEEMRRLFSPRDFLFSNAAQVQRLVEMRQSALIDQDGDVH